jgi:hypothetical protein
VEATTLRIRGTGVAVSTQCLRGRTTATAREHERRVCRRPRQCRNDAKASARWERSVALAGRPWQNCPVAGSARSLVAASGSDDPGPHACGKRFDRRHFNRREAVVLGLRVVRDARRRHQARRRPAPVPTRCGDQRGFCRRSACVISSSRRARRRSGRRRPGSGSGACRLRLSRRRPASGRRIPLPRCPSRTARSRPFLGSPFRLVSLVGRAIGGRRRTVRGRRRDGCERRRQVVLRRERFRRRLCRAGPRPCRHQWSAAARRAPGCRSAPPVNGRPRSRRGPSDAPGTRLPAAAARGSPGVM